MIVAIHQPNFLPWLGYFYKIYKSEVFVFLDNVQLPIGRSFCHRNKVKTSNGEIWLSLPILRAGKTLKKLLINQVKIDNSQNWRRKHLKTLEMNYKKVRYFSEVFKLTEDIYYLKDWEYLADFNIELIKKFTEYIGLNVNFVKASELNVEGRSTELLIQIVKKTDGDIYLSGFGGVEYQEEKLFKKEGIKLEYYNFVHPEYHQLWGAFVPNLSVIDLIFNMGEKSGEIIRKNKKFNQG